MRRSCQGQRPHRVGTAAGRKPTSLRMSLLQRQCAGASEGGFGGQPGKGVAMKRYALIVCAALGMVLSSGMAQASGLTYSGWQPWWNIFAYRPKCMTCEEERLQHFWHDYYHALGKYYKALDH